MQRHVPAAALILMALRAPDSGVAQMPDRLPGNVVEVSARDFSLTAPESIPAGLTTFRLTQAGSAGHQLWIRRLEPGRTFDEFAAAIVEGRPTPWATQLGGPGFTDPPLTTNATLVLQPGIHALVCYMGAEGDARAHAKKGMVRRLDVMMAATASTVEPSADVVATILEDGYDFSPTLSAGRHVLKVRNTTSTEQQFRIQRVLPGHTVDEALTFRRGTAASGRLIEGVAGAPPFETSGRLVGIRPGHYLITTIDLKPGTYLVTSQTGRATSSVFEVR